jgi:uncharacterized protein (DUF3820 family)
MPFGKYAGRRLVDLPEPYVVWLSRKGFPKGELGELLSTVYMLSAITSWTNLQKLDCPLPGSHYHQQ